MDKIFTPSATKLAKKTGTLYSIIKQFGYPPVWTRRANFKPLFTCILEQQVSLASAKAALNKLKEKIGTVTPKKLLALSDEELRSCYFSRQKTVYARCLGNALVSKQIILRTFSNLGRCRNSPTAKTDKRNW
jgi:DNA-3-methyladenine glycosylase II